MKSLDAWETEETVGMEAEKTGTETEETGTGIRRDMRHGKQKRQ